jgi:hypothetical protein
VQRGEGPGAPAIGRPARATRRSALPRRSRIAHPEGASIMEPSTSFSNRSSVGSGGAVERQEPRAADAVRAQGRTLVVWRVIEAGLAALSLALFVASLPARYDQLAHPEAGVRAALAQLGLPVSFYAAFNLGLETLFALGFLALALVIAAHKSDTARVLFFPFMLIMVGTAAIPILPTMSALTVAAPALLPLVRFVTFATWTSVFVFFCIFPDGAFRPRWTTVYAAIAIVVSIPWNLFPDSPLSPWTWPAPVLGLFELAIWGTGAYIQIYRYRHVADTTQRQQTRWVVFGLSVSIAGIVGFYVPRALNPALAHPTDAATLAIFLISSAAIVLSALCTPLAIAVSILRYRLWAVDLLINRTLVYGALTTLLALIYLGSVVLLQSGLAPVFGPGNDLAIVISTLLVAALFLPLRRQIQTFIDQRFYRRKYDAAHTLARFTGTMAQEVDLQRLANSLIEIVDETMQPTQMSLWLRDPPRGDPGGGASSA